MGETIQNSFDAIKPSGSYHVVGMSPTGSRESSEKEDNFISSKIVPYRPEQQILIHSDCSTLVDAVLSSETLSWEIQPLVDRAKRKLEDSSSIILAHCNRDTNRVADWLAKAHRLGCLPRDWVNYPPPALLDLLCADASYVCTNNCS